MPRHPLPRATPPPPCPPWLVGRAGYKKQFENYQRTLKYYKRYQALLAKEPRRRATAEKRARQHMLMARELKRRLSKILVETAPTGPATMDPYLKAELEP